MDSELSVSIFHIDLDKLIDLRKLSALSTKEMYCTDVLIKAEFTEPSVADGLL